jgi:diguanylate cyclase (GGDEF)-like protein
MAASERFSVGWYLGRFASVMASSALLGVLIWEIANLYRALHAANIKLGEYAVLDGLTGIFNRRYFDQRYPAALRQANETGRPLALLMVDIDRFKNFNDNYGHQRGDECLIAVAHALKGCLRRTGDFVARYGGEEFVIVLPECSQEMAGQIAEALRDGVEELGIEAHFTDMGHLTVSIGLAASGGTGRTIPATLLAQADAALYRAKSEGRNRVAA